MNLAGAYGNVLRGKDRDSGRDVAIKITNIVPGTGKLDLISMRTLREIKLLKALRHENIVEFMCVMHGLTFMSPLFAYICQYQPVNNCA